MSCFFLLAKYHAAVRESVFSIFCQPRDITLHDRSIMGDDKKRLKTDIAIDIRLAQGMDDEKARAKLKYRK